MSSLFTRISLVFFFILLTLSLTTLWVSHRNSQNYFLEFTQQLNAPIARFVAENSRLVKGSKPDPDALALLATHISILNPSIEVYLLDMDGNVLLSEEQPRVYQEGNTVGQSDLVKEGFKTVKMEPIEKFLEPDVVYPILGTNPVKSEADSIFSVYPIWSDFSIADETEQIGYVYAVLTGEKHRSLVNSLTESYSLKNLAVTLSETLLLALIAGISLFFILTRRLGQLIQRAGVWQQKLEESYRTSHVNRHKVSESSARSDVKNTDGFKLLKEHDEIDVLASTYDSMASALLQQYQDLQEQDANRRQFFAQISHDLRTPLTTMQSYLETLALKSEELSSLERNRYIDTAHKQCVRLRQLVMQLFELSKLTSGNIKLDNEPFSLLELALDVAQEYALKAEALKIKLIVEPRADEKGEFIVLADIALIQRALENLLGNSLRFTPENGHITINLNLGSNSFISVSVTDTGAGISEKKLESLLATNTPSLKLSNGVIDSAGLGLSIVRSIVGLHGSELLVESSKRTGTRCSFNLLCAQ